ncbi:unnamed protein product [Angiostrongylus costaricensis]|uniref:C2H2-type domain-containing protein n=1 Tax=Angiostrongylus costaricensis TaxID=334426 RepID=A0A0R3PEG5_ANGCS|nr:unnamed protein product [Angiostrongylus costaricensis]
MTLNRGAFFSFFDGQIEAHQKDIDFEADESSDYIEAFLKGKRRREANGDITYSCKACVSTCGSQEWKPLLTHFHECVHEELDREIGSGRAITMSDKKSVPYTNAEIQRMADLLAINLPHETMSSLGGQMESSSSYGSHRPDQYFALHIPSIPADSLMKMERKKVSRKQSELGVKDAQKFVKVEELIPFTFGKRQCLGEGLARMELFLFTANLFNRYFLAVMC